MDGFGSYLQAISAIPPLSRAEQRALTERMRDPALSEPERTAARDRLVESCLKLVVTQARIQLKRAPHVGLEELVAEGNRRLVEAVMRYDPGRGASLGTHVVAALRFQLRTFLRQDRTVHLPRYLMDSRRGVDAARNPAVRAAARRLLEPSGPAPALDELPAPSGPNQVEEDEARRALRAALRGAAARLDPRAGDLICRRYGLDAEGVEQTTQAVARAWGVAPETVRLWEHAALKRLARRLQAPGGDPRTAANGA